jgi:hypothetical protein
LGSAGGVFFIVVALLSGGGPGVDDTNGFAALGETDYEEALLGRTPYDDLAGLGLRVVWVLVDAGQRIHEHRKRLFKLHAVLLSPPAAPAVRCGTGLATVSFTRFPYGRNDFLCRKP